MNLTGIDNVDGGVGYGCFGVECACFAVSGGNERVGAVRDNNQDRPFHGNPGRVSRNVVC